jgi:transcriptional regulator with XRE-family HTH domain
MTLGERIKKIRLSKNLTLDDMANRLGYSNRSAFYKIENGYGNFKIKKLIQIVGLE